MINNYKVIPIDAKTAYPFFKKIHYAKRIPSISYCFGLYDENKLIGCCSFGTPASSTLLKGVAGEKYKDIVIELNRLVLLNNEKNIASFFTSACIRLLPKPKIIVSYADTSMGHNGYVYQACNFYYTGLSSKFLDPKVKGLEHQHHATYANGLSNEELKIKYGDLLYFQERPRKHRYIYIHSSKTEKKHILKSMTYKIEQYPKGENQNYKVSIQNLEIQSNLFT
jgi:hypothetical protein